jgi:hypothetical protein
VWQLAVTDVVRTFRRLIWTLTRGTQQVNRGPGSRTYATCDLGPPAPQEETGPGARRQLCGSLSPRPENCRVVSWASAAAITDPPTRLYRLEKLPCHVVNNRVQGSNRKASNIGPEGTLVARRLAEVSEVTELLLETYEPRQVLSSARRHHDMVANAPYTHLLRYLP